MVVGLSLSLCGCLRQVQVTSLTFSWLSLALSLSRSRLGYIMVLQFSVAPSVVVGLPVCRFLDAGNQEK